MESIDEASQQISRAERHEFQRLFDAVTSRLPSMFRPFWNRWEVSGENSSVLVIYNENGAEVTRLSRSPRGTYQAVGVTSRGPVTYATSAITLKAALEVMGLL